jgi:hypothetical protein
MDVQILPDLGAAVPVRHKLLRCRPAVPIVGGTVAGSTQATIAVAAPSFAKRKARALIGWLTEQEGALWIAGREMQATPDPAHIARC